MTSRTHPISVPSVAGMYESARFPLKDGYNPYLVTENGALVEFSLVGKYYFELDAVLTKSYGPWRQLNAREIKQLKEAQGV